jgi:hypothetical protein
MSSVRSRIGCAATGGSTGQAFYASESYVQNWFRPRGTGGIHWDNATTPTGRYLLGIETGDSLIDENNLFID